MPRRRNLWVLCFGTRRLAEETVEPPVMRNMIDSPCFVFETGCCMFADEWCRQTMRSRIDPMNEEDCPLPPSAPGTDPQLPQAQKLISSGVVEGLNNKAKVTMRKPYGFRTYRVLELALYYSLGKLPEPESTHDFF